jgi:hypothetical protein
MNRTRKGRALPFARAALLVIVALGLVALQGCGRKGTPERPEGSEFPRAYPYYPKLPDPANPPNPANP